MKKNCSLFLIILIAMILSSCSSPKKIEGNWAVASLIKNGQSVPLVESNIKFVLQNKKLKALGCAGVNLFNCDVIIKGKKIQTSDMVNTGFMGLADEMDYENLFFQILMNAKTFAIKHDTLYLYAPDENMEMQLTHLEK